MKQQPPRSTLTDALVPNTTLVRSDASRAASRSTDRYRVQPIVGRRIERQQDAPGDGAWLVQRRTVVPAARDHADGDRQPAADRRSEEHTSELQSLMRISYAVFCLKQKQRQDESHSHIQSSTN